MAKIAKMGLWTFLYYSYSFSKAIGLIKIENKDETSLIRLSIQDQNTLELFQEEMIMKDIQDLMDNSHKSHLPQKTLSLRMQQNLINS